MLLRPLIAAVAMCLVLLTGCTGGDGSEGSGGAADPGKPLATMGEDGLPADYPRDEVPLVEGEVTSVSDGSRKDPGYAVSVVTDVPTDEALEQAVGLLEGAGWTASGGSDAAAVRVLSRDGDLVVVRSSVSGDRTLLAYAIDVT